MLFSAVRPIWADYQLEDTKTAQKACAAVSIVFFKLTVNAGVDGFNQQASSMQLIYKTSLFSTPLPFWTCIITFG